MLRRLLFWVPTALVAWVYAGYPLTAALAGLLRPFRVQPTLPTPELVTVGIAVHNEAAELAERVADVLAQEVSFRLDVIIASDGSTDDTERVAAEIVAREPSVRLLALPRAGTTAAQNAIFVAARGDVVVLTDAETRFRPRCLAALVEPFTDRRLGCVTGRLLWADGTQTDTSQQEGLYWRYEQTVRRLESHAGWLTAVTGAMLAVRRDSYRHVPDHTSLDHLLPLYVREQGQTVIAVRDAVATDRGIASLHEQFRNRARTATRGIQANLSMAGRLAPWRRPSASLAIWSHKLLRWSTPWLAIVGATGAVFLVREGRRAYLLPLAGGTGTVGLAVVGYVLRGRGPTPRWAAFPLAVVVVNVAFLRGWLNLLRGQRLKTWHRTKWDVD
ncbi:glycosyltransferase family 2 protein [soil metagenome]